MTIIRRKSCTIVTAALLVFKPRSEQHQIIQLNLTLHLGTETRTEPSRPLHTFVTPTRSAVVSLDVARRISRPLVIVSGFSSVTFEKNPENLWSFPLTRRKLQKLNGWRGNALTLWECIITMTYLRTLTVTMLYQSF